MDGKMLYSIGTNAILAGVLIASWCLGKDGVVTTALIGLIGANTGAIIGFKIGKEGL
jgi:hypothetical protein